MQSKIITRCGKGVEGMGRGNVDVSEGEKIPHVKVGLFLIVHVRRRAEG